nr:F-box/FBD/LRR-repeat protein At1g13570-like [Ipomoea batatas]
MAQQLKTLLGASRDLISELPVEIKDRILECLTTRDAARTALLSTHWNDVWLQHEQLTFDCDFVQSFQQSQDVEGRTLVSIINNILFSRAGPVKKFTLEIDTENDPSPLPHQSDIDRWTIKKLIVEGPDIDLPLSACGIFSNVTSLAFLNVAFDRNVRKIQRKLERFPRASPNIQIVCTGASMSEDWMDTHGVRLLGY